jgi:hypothetical protein
MDRDTQKPRVEQDGVRVFEHSSDHRAARPRFVAAVLAVVVLGTTAVLFLRRNVNQAVPEATMPAAEEQPVAARPSSKLRAFHAARVESARVQDPVGGARVQDPAPSSAAVEQERVPPGNLVSDVIGAWAAAGTKEGIGVYPPPGTDPIKIGLVVPEEFELPEGYVRHYQITDDGRRLEPILMFSPDHPPVDENGQPIPLPEHGIVPADMAPPGMPLRQLAVPEPSRRADAILSHEDRQGGGENH